MTDHPPYDPHVDGRPPVDWHDDDPLLAALVREHPERTPAELVDQLMQQPSRGRVDLASTSA